MNWDNWSSSWPRSKPPSAAWGRAGIIVVLELMSGINSMKYLTDEDTGNICEVNDFSTWELDDTECLGKSQQRAHSSRGTIPSLFINHRGYFLSWIWVIDSKIQVSWFLFPSCWCSELLKFKPTVCLSLFLSLRPSSSFCSHKKQCSHLISQQNYETCWVNSH